MKRLPWGHKSRRCVFCGRVGPRTLVVGGWAHKRCLPSSDRSLSTSDRTKPTYKEIMEDGAEKIG